MKKIILILTTILLLSSCWLPKDEAEEKAVVEKKIVEQKKVLVSRFKEETLEKIKKFDKNNTRSKVENMTWFLCFDDTITHPWTKLSIKAKNCKNEKNDKVVYFKVKWNSIYKVVDENEEELIKIESSKIEKETMWTYIVNNIIPKFREKLDIMYCRYRRLTKKDFLNNDQNKEIYAIEPIGFYKMESLKQIKKDPNTTVCEWYFPDLKIFFIYDSKYPKNFLHVLRKDVLMDFETLKYN